MSTPSIVSSDLRVVTSEYDRFDKTNERLDVVGLVKRRDGIGRLVVIELKRHGQSTTVDLQAIKYAAYLSSASFENVCRMYADDRQVSLDDASTELGEWLGGPGGEAPKIDDTPGIVLLAGDFKPEVTTTVLWLIDNFRLDIRCVRLLPYQVGDQLVVASEQLIPLPAAEDYRLGIQQKQRAEHKEASTKSGRLLPRLVESDLVQVGDVLKFKRSEVGSSVTDNEYEASPRYRAKIVDPNSTASLEWHDSETDEVTRQSPSLLAAWVRALESGKGIEGVTSTGINGYKHWTIDGQTSLRDLAVEQGVISGSGTTLDRDMLTELCSAIPRGRWTTYGLLADAIGAPGAAMVVASIVASDDAIQNARRVLRSDGSISPDWRSDDGEGPEHCRSLLEAEGLTFSASGRADPAKKWIPAAGSHSQ